MSFDVTKLQEMSSEDEAYVERFGVTTAWEMLQQYGISKVKVSRAIHAGLLRAFMQGDSNGIHLKWYIVMDDLYTAFVEKNKKFDSLQQE